MSKKAKIEDMLSNESINSLDEIKVIGIGQFEKECFETSRLQNEVCHMNALHENSMSDDADEFYGSNEMIFAEHCSPRTLV